MRAYHVFVQNKDDDEAAMTVIQKGNITDEASNLTASITIRLESQPIEPVTVILTSSNDREGNCVPSSIIFTAQSYAENHEVTVQGVDDDIDDDDQIYSVIVSTQTTDPNYHGIKYILTFENIDDDEMGMRIEFLTARNASTEWGGSAEFLIFLLSEPTDAVLFSISSTDPSEGIADPSLLVLAGDNWDTGSAVTVTGQRDNLDDGDTPFNIQIAPMISQDRKYRDMKDEKVMIITRDEPANRVRIHSYPPWIRTSEDGSFRAVTIALDYFHVGAEQQFEYVKVTLRIADKGEGKFEDGSIMDGSHVLERVWLPADCVTVCKNLTFIVEGVDDPIEDGTVTHNLTITAEVKTVGIDAVTSVPEYRLFPPQIMIMNDDNDMAGISVNTISQKRNIAAAGRNNNLRYITTEDGDWIQLDIKLESQPIHPVTIAVASSVPSEGKPEVSSIVIQPQDWNLPHPVKIRGVDDTAPESEYYEYEVTLGPTISDDIKYQNVTLVYPFANRDNEQSSLTVIFEDPVREVDESGSSQIFHIRLPNRPTHDATVFAYTDNSEAGIISPSKVVFTRDTWNLRQSFTVSGKDNLLVGCGEQRSAKFSHPESGDETSFSVGEGTVYCTEDGNTKFNVLLDVQSEDKDLQGSKLTYPFVNRDDEILRTNKKSCETSESGSSCAIELSLLSGSWLDNRFIQLTVIARSTNLAEGFLNSSKFVFDPKNPYRTHYLLVTGVDDDFDDDQQEFNVEFQSTLQYDFANPMTKEISAEKVRILNNDDDVAAIAMIKDIFINQTIYSKEVGQHDINFSPLITPLQYHFYFDEQGQTFLEFDLVLNSEPYQDVYIPVKPDRPETICFAEGSKLIIHHVDQNSNYQQVDVTVKEDKVNGSMLLYKSLNGVTTKMSFAQSHFRPDDAACRGSVTYDNDKTGQEIPVTHGCITQDRESYKDQQIPPKGGAILTFTRLNWREPQRVIVFGVDDYVQDYDVTHKILIGPSTSQDLKYNEDHEMFLNVTTLDDDHIGLIVEVENGLNETSENGEKVGQVSVRLGTQPKDTVLFTMSTSKPAEASLTPQILAFSIDNWRQKQTITVRGNDDALSDGDQEYFVSARTLFTNDPDYGHATTGMLTEQVGFVNYDDLTDRNPDECDDGYYGSLTDHSCRECPVGRYSDINGNTSTYAACKPCAWGTYGPLTAQTSLWTACLPCPTGKYAPSQAMSTCSDCPSDRICSFGAMSPSIFNLSDRKNDERVKHHWKLLEEVVYQENWDFLNMTVNEETLQLIMLFVMSGIVGLLVLCMLGVFIAYKMQWIDVKHWASTKSFMKSFDQFDDDHMKCKELTIEGDDKRTLMGGVFSIWFFSLSWSLLGIILFIFNSYNREISQSLVPKTDSSALRTTLKAQVEFQGFTGKCPPTGLTIRATGVEAFGGEETEISCDQAFGVLKVGWSCKQCELSSPSLTVEYHGGDFPVSASFLQWRLNALPVIPNEQNGVNGTIRPDVDNVLFRGERATVATVVLIPARYKNSISNQELNGYRLQYMSESLGSYVDQNEYMRDNSIPLGTVQNSLKYNLKMTASAVQLDTLVTAKMTLLDIWAIAGGLFGAIGAAVILLMNAIELLMVRICGFGQKVSISEDQVHTSGKKDKKGKGGKGGKDGKGKGKRPFKDDDSSFYDPTDFTKPTNPFKIGNSETYDKVLSAVAAVENKAESHRVSTKANENSSDSEHDSLYDSEYDSEWDSDDSDSAEDTSSDDSARGLLARRKSRMRLNRNPRDARSEISATEDTEESDESDGRSVSDATRSKKGHKKSPKSSHDSDSSSQYPLESENDNDDWNDDWNDNPLRPAKPALNRSRSRNTRD